MRGTRAGRPLENDAHSAVGQCPHGIVGKRRAQQVPAHAFEPRPVALRSRAPQLNGHPLDGLRMMRCRRGRSISEKPPRKSKACDLTVGEKGLTIRERETSWRMRSRGPVMRAFDLGTRARAEVPACDG